MSQEKMQKVLVDLGLSKIDARVYVFLARKGPQKARDLVTALKVTKQQLYTSLRSLESKGLAASNLERPAKFSTVSFEEALDLFAKAKMEEAASIKQSKDKLLSDWQSIVIQEAHNKGSTFTVIEGRKYVYSKIHQMIQETKKQLSTITTVQSLLRVYEQGILDAALNHPLKSKIQFRFLAEGPEEHFKALDNMLRRVTATGFNLKGRKSDLGLNLSPRMVIRDNEELLFFTRPPLEKESCLWTTCKELVRSFVGIFEELWSSSTNIVDEYCIKEDIISAQSFDFEFIGKKFKNSLSSAKQEILALISIEDLMDLLKKSFLLEACTKNLSVKIMAPVTMKNFDVISQLPNNIEVRHIPECYLETLVIDSKQLFQFKTNPSHLIKSNRTSHSKDAFYTNDPKHVKRLKNQLNDVWKSARTPSSVTLESIMGKHGFIYPPNYLPLRKVKGYAVFSEVPGSISEKDVLNKITQDIKPRSSNEIGKMYASAATAIIHPPEHLCLPEMMIHVDHIQKRSWFGQGDALLVYLKPEQPEEYLFTLAGGIGDNPKGVSYRKKYHFTNKIAKENYRLVKKDELQVRVHGNTMFAGWTVPIPLFPKYTLPPACILIEGYGKIKTQESTVISSSGYKSELQTNYLDAYVTFILPSSKYSGPGTEGIFFRDLVTTTTIQKEKQIKS